MIYIIDFSTTALSTTNFPHPIDEFSAVVSTSTSTEAKTEAERMETAIIILSNLIASHPSLTILDKTIQSLQILKGLHPKTPMFITVDGPRPAKYQEVIDVKTLERLDAYTEALYKRFSGTEYSHVTIVVNPCHQHITGSIRKVVHSLIDPKKTKYMYVLQHDLRFVYEHKTIDHKALVKTFNEYNGDLIIRRVMFSQYTNRHYRRKGLCKKERAHFGLDDPWLIANGTDGGLDTAIDIDINIPDTSASATTTITTNTTHATTANNTTATSGSGVYLSFSATWSDNNHFTTVDYYKELLARLGSKLRSPEDPLQKLTKRNCTYWGTHLYGKPGDGEYICHMDGRNVSNRKGYNNCRLEEV